MWKPVVGYEGLYEVSDDGKVRSVDRIVHDTKGRYTGIKKRLRGVEMKTPISNGYPVVNIHRDSVSNVVPVHVLVAEAFIPNPNNYPTVNHIDGDKTNNHVENLEWASYAQNNVHALKTGLRKPRGNPIAQYTIDGELVGVYKSAYEATRQTGLSFNNISHCLNGRARTAYGYIWKRVSESPTTIPTGSTREDELPVEVQRPIS